jgi:NADH:ubiquinone oxidoreductase subunit H
MISYEISLGAVLLTVLVVNKTLNLSEIVDNQMEI